MRNRFATTDMGRKLGAAVPLFGGIGEGRKQRQLHGTSTDVEWPVIASLIITLEGNRWQRVIERGKTDDAKWLMETLIGSSKVA